MIFELFDEYLIYLKHNENLLKFYQFKIRMKLFGYFEIMKPNGMGKHPRSRLAHFHESNKIVYCMQAGRQIQ